MIGEHSELPGVEIPPAWQEAANSIAYDSSSRRPPTSLVCGPGNCGKSTFSLHLLNTLLKRYERVAYLDTDVGQAEFTPPGCISLFIFDNPIPDLSILCLKTPESVSIKKEARVVRDLRVVSYFRQCMPRDLDISSYKELVHSFATVHPYELHFSEIGVIGFHYQAPSSEPFQSLDKSIVGLGDSSMLPSESENYTNRWCIGLGFVVAVDITKDLLYLITPVPRTRMKKVDLLLQGSIETPTCLLQVHGCIAASLTSNLSDDNAQMAETTKLLTRLKAT